MKRQKCQQCGHSLGEFSDGAYCVRLDCWCHPHGACPIPTPEFLRERGWSDEEIATRHTVTEVAA